MRVLLNEGTPRRLRRHLGGHEVLTVQRMGWAGMKNGALLARADREFDALVTPDRHLRHQQNLGRLTRLGIVLLVGGHLRPNTVLAAAPAVDAALRQPRPGALIEVRVGER